jgi:anhydro-N-acetylmuramic acid kinase
MTGVIGLISGTSVDGIDAVLTNITVVDTNELRVELLAGETVPYPEELRSQVLAVAGGASISMAQLAELDEAIAAAFAQAASTINAGYDKAQLIGSHGQTVYHRPPEKTDNIRLGYSVQLGRGATIAQLTGISTVCNFRAADIAAGGHGAPLVSKVDAYLLSDKKSDRCVQNLGGIGNLTYLPARDSFSEEWCDRVVGWDTGPANSLLDLAVQRLSGGKQTYDKNGAWAARGSSCQELVEKWLQQDFFQEQPPKSTGRELFGKEYLENCFADAANYDLSDADFLATLTELTAASIVLSYQNFLPKMPEQVLLCGGGSHNLYLKERLEKLLGKVEVLTTAEMGLNADFKEAIAFAVLAYWHYLGIPGNLPQVTGAKAAVLLGEMFNN